MAREIPEVVRAAAGLAATVLDEARRLPETLPGLPVRALGLAMQQAMKVQQQYAGLVARGDELFTGLRGADEPGLATFDEDEDQPAAGGFRESAFDRADAPAGDGRADELADELADEEVGQLPADPAADAVTAVVDELADQVEDGRQSIEELVEEAPEIEEILDEIAIDELVDQSPTSAGTAPTGHADTPAPALPESDQAPSTEETADVLTGVDVLTADGSDVTSVDATVTDEGIAAPIPAGDDDPAGSTAIDEGGTPVAAAAGVGTDGTDTDTDTATDSIAPTEEFRAAAPIDGYDGFSVAQLRGRLRGYQLNTVQDLLSYEQATRNREPYLRMLRNRLEKLEQLAVESSPLAPRG
jgi:hypothetical protein